VRGFSMRGWPDPDQHP